MLKSFLGGSVRLDAVVPDLLQVGVLQDAEKLLGRPACLGRSRFFYVSSSSCLLARRDLLTQNMWTVMGDIQDAEELL